MRVGVIGGGTIGRLRAESLKGAGNHELVAVLDVSDAAASPVAAGTGALATGDRGAFFETNPEIVFISTPPHTHRDFAEAAFAAGAHVFCEKPLAHSVDDARAMVVAATAAERRLGVGFNMRYYPFAKAIREALEQDRIGPITHVRAFGGHDGLHHFNADWQYKMPHSGGGAMMDIGIHITDLVRHFLGDITEVSGVMTESVWNLPGSEDNAMALFRNPDGIPASYQATWHEWRGYRNWIEVYGERGMARGSYAPMQSLILTRTADGKTMTRKNYYPEIMLREKLKSWTSTARLTFEDELRDFVRTIETGADSPVADGHDGLRAIEVAEAVRRSSETGETVRLEPLGRMS